MKKRLLSLLLILEMLVSPVMAVSAFDTEIVSDVYPEANAVAYAGFVKPVAVELPQKVTTGFIGEDVSIPNHLDDSFIVQPSGNMPEIREDGFLAEPTQPLKVFPERGKLLAAVGKPEEGAKPISTAEELAKITSGGSYYLTQDIDFSNIIWNQMNVDNVTLDGQGHTIKNTTGAVVLFNHSKNLTVRNLNLETYVTSRYAYNYYAAVVQIPTGDLLIENCVLRNPENKYCSGGLVGKFEDKNGNIVIRDCAVDVYFRTTDDQGNAVAMEYPSGIVNSVVSANTIELTDCIVQVDVDLSSLSDVVFGGLVHKITCNTMTATRCSVSGDIVGTSTYCAGMVHNLDADYISFTDSSFEGNIKYVKKVDGNRKYSDGGFVSVIYGNISTVFTNCRVVGSMNNFCDAETDMGGFVGKFLQRYPTNNAYVYYYKCLAGMDIHVLHQDFNNNTSSHYKYSVGGLVSRAPASLYAEECLSTGSLSQDISVDVKKLENICIGGMVGYTATPTTMQFVRCENRGSVTSAFYSSGIVGYAEPTAGSVRFTDCKNSGTIQTTFGRMYIPYYRNQEAYASGLLGYGCADLTNCINTGEIISRNASGLAYQSDILKNCRSTCTIKSPYYIGGMSIVGNKAIGCTVDIDITAVPSNRWFCYVGGLFAIGGGNIDSCSVRLQINDAEAENTYGGGIVGLLDNELNVKNTYVELVSHGSYFEALGGMVGSSYYLSQYHPINIYNCAAKLDVSSPQNTEGATVGGFVGYTRDSIIIDKSYATGAIDMCIDVTGEVVGYAGGMVGHVDDSNASLIISQCWTDMKIHDADYMGGFVGLLENSQGTIYSSWADGSLTVNAKDSTYDFPTAMGGLSNGNVVLQDCCFLGTTDWRAYYAGGIVGKGGSINNCYATAEIMKESVGGGTYVGGLMGSGDSVQNCHGTGVIHYGNLYLGSIAGSCKTIKNCTSDATIYAHGVIGGLVGICDSMTDCRSNATIYGSGKVGGLAGNVHYIENCQSNAVIYGSNIGGIAGSLTHNGTMENCISNAFLYINATDGDSSYLIGGLVANANGIIYNSHYTRQMNYHFDDSSTKVRIGSIVGYLSGSVTQCSGKGVNVTCSNSDNIEIYAGGIVGKIDSECYITECQVSDNVSVCASNSASRWDDTYNDLYVGGLVGGGYGGGLHLLNVNVSGNVTAEIISEALDDNEIYIGGFLGYGKNLKGKTLYIENSHFTGNLNYTKAYLYTYFNYTPALPITTIDKSYVSYADVPEIQIPEREVEGYLVKVQGTTDLVHYAPLSNASVYVDGVSVGTTDTYGEVEFSNKDVSSNAMVWVSAEADGYFETTMPTFLADKGTTTLSLKAKKPGEIYIQSATLQTNAGITDLLTEHTTLRIPQLDTNLYPLTVKIDWNDLEEEGRSLYLTNEDGTSTIRLEDGTTYVCLTDTFSAAEEIYLIAKGKYNGSLVETKKLLRVKIQAVDVKLPTPKGNMQVGGEEKDESGNNKFLYFLKGLSIGIEFDDLTKYASDISYKNGNLKFEFSTYDKEKETISVWSGFTDKVEVAGSISIPITDLYAGDWSGEITASIGQSGKTSISQSSVDKYNEKQEKDENKLTYDFFIAGWPCFLETGLSVGGSAMFGVHGPYDKVYVQGEVEPTGSVSIFGGLGRSITEEVELKFGGEGKIDIKIPMRFDTQDESVFELDPSFKGSLSAKATLKAFILDLEGKLELGAFKWDKNGAVWTLAGEPIQEPATYALTSDSWEAMGRAYLANGGGFLTEDFHPYAFQQSKQNLRYDNIGALAETSVATDTSGQVVLYYTADDGNGGTSGNVAEHTVLWRSVQQSDGTWSVPTAISKTSDGYPASPHASGDYVVWVTSPSTDSLDDMLSVTNINVAKNGEMVATYAIDGYAYAPKISASADGSKAVICWKQKKNMSSADLTGGTSTLYYADNLSGTWSESGTNIYIKNTALTAVPFCGTSISDSYIYYIDNRNEYYRFPLNSYSKSLDTVSSGRTVMCADVVAVFCEDGTLAINHNYAQKTLTTKYNGTATPALSYNGTNYVLTWPEDTGIYCTVSENGTSWSEPVWIAPLNSNTTSLAVTSIGSDPFVVYTQNDGDLTHLYTTSMCADQVDLVMQSLDYDPNDILEYGYIIFKGQVYNNGLKDNSGFKLIVTDENGQNVYENTFHNEIPSGEIVDFNASFATDGLRAHTYTFTVIPGNGATEGDASDNSLDISVGEARAKFVDTSFLAMSDGTMQLQAMLQNTGAALLENVTIQVSDETGTVIESTHYDTTNAIPSASIRQFVVESVQPNVLYRVSALHGDTVLDSTTMMFEDLSASLLTASLNSLEGEKAMLTVSSQNIQADSCKMIFALYSGGKMTNVGTTELKLVDGKQKVNISLNGIPKSGNYSYRVFFLSADGNYVPLSQNITGDVKVP